MVSCFHSWTKVFMAKRLAGGVAMIDKSRMPEIDMLSVRGMGVAVRVKTSISARYFLICSFWVTPKRCSSSRMNKPSRLRLMSCCNSLWVPITMSAVPSVIACLTTSSCFLERKRDMTSILTGQSAKRSLKFS